MTEAKVKITDPLHLYVFGTASGLAEAREALENLPDHLRQTPGVALAIAIIGREAEAARVSLLSRNFAALARAGVDVGRHRAIEFDPKAAQLICKLDEPDLQSPEAR